ncbi:iron-containing alcohol dehydrogenase [Microbacterium sp. MTN4-26]|uniref:iron-containing alcohol dehydrogenase n=1 Tax=unclassified Microbacterium TaxID=2609290 RepID=UPI0036F3F368
MYAMLRSPEQIVFGRGQRHRIPHLVAQRGTRAFIVVDPFLADAPDIAALRDAMTDLGIQSVLFSDVVPELPVHAISAAASAASEFGADVFVAVGGGSSIDTAKMAVVLAAHGGEVSDYYGEGKVPGPVPPIIAAPTTAGTGSEVTPVAVITDPVRESKVGVSSPYLIPTVAVLDPELTLSCPPAVTAASGADALCHAIEAYTAVKGDPASTASPRVFMGSTALTDLLGLEAVRRLAAGLVRAYRTPDDLEARSLTLYGALLAGLAFGTAGTAAAHALQYPVGAVTHTSHGIGVGLLLPYVMAVNAPARQAELAEVALALGAEPASEAELAEQAPLLVRTLMTDIGIPASLAELDFPRDRLPWAAEESLKARRLADNNPVPLTAETALRILEAAYEGSLTSPPSATGGNR